MSVPKIGTDFFFLVVHYLLSFSIRITAVIDEPWNAALVWRIDEIFRWKRHEVKVLRIIFGIFLSSFSKLRRVQNFADIFHQKSVRETISGCSKADTFISGFKNFEGRIFSVLEPKKRENLLIQTSKFARKIKSASWHFPSGCYEI